MDQNIYHILQIGCASNYADSSKLALFLQERGATITENIKEASIVIIFSCGFSSLQYTSTLDLISSVNEKKMKDAEIWLGGCVPAINKDITSIFPFPIAKVFTPRNFENIFDSEITTTSKNSTNLPHFLQGTLNSYPIRIVNGCSEYCKYCVIKKAGGDTQSKPIVKILEEIKRLDDSNYSISLVGEEVGAFGHDTEETLLDLVQKIIGIRPNIKISFSAIHPKYFCNDFEQYIAIYSYENILPFLPLPLQSGSNKVLKLMNRDYLIDDVLNKLSLFLSKFPTVKLSTDIMVGFPGETWEDFISTKEMVQKLPLSSMDCFKFDNMKELNDTVPENEKVRRLKIISLSFLKKLCIENNINDISHLEKFLKHNHIPLNLNI